MVRHRPALVLLIVIVVIISPLTSMLVNEVPINVGVKNDYRYEFNLIVLN